MNEPSSALSHLECTGCGAQFDADRLENLCTACGRVLYARYDLEQARRTLTREALGARGRGMWRWREIMPVRDARHIVSLGEGDTPLLPVPRLGEGILVKDEGLSPTGSFKARGISAAVSRRLQYGGAQARLRGHAGRDSRRQSGDPRLVGCDRHEAARQEPRGAVPVGG